MLTKLLSLLTPFILLVSVGAIPTDVTSQVVNLDKLNPRGPRHKEYFDRMARLRDEIFRLMLRKNNSLERKLRAESERLTGQTLKEKKQYIDPYYWIDRNRYANDLMHLPPKGSRAYGGRLSHLQKNSDDFYGALYQQAWFDAFVRDYRLIEVWDNILDKVDEEMTNFVSMKKDSPEYTNLPSDKQKLLDEFWHVKKQIDEILEQVTELTPAHPAYKVLKEIEEQQLQFTALIIRLLGMLEKDWESDPEFRKLPDSLKADLKRDLKRIRKIVRPGNYQDALDAVEMLMSYGERMPLRTGQPKIDQEQRPSIIEFMHIPEVREMIKDLVENIERRD